MLCHRLLYVIINYIGQIKDHFLQRYLEGIEMLDFHCQCKQSMNAFVSLVAFT